MIGRSLAPLGERAAGDAANAVRNQFAIIDVEKDATRFQLFMQLQRAGNPGGGHSCGVDG